MKIEYSIGYMTGTTIPGWVQLRGGGAVGLVKLRLKMKKIYEI